MYASSSSRVDAMLEGYIVVAAVGKGWISIVVAILFFWRGLEFPYLSYIYCGIYSCNK